MGSQKLWTWVREGLWECQKDKKQRERNETTLNKTWTKGNRDKGKNWRTNMGEWGVKVETWEKEKRRKGEKEKRRKGEKEKRPKAKGRRAKAKGQRPRPRQRPRQRGKEATRQRSKEAKKQRKERKKNGTPEGLIGKKATTISILSVPQMMYLEFFLSGTIRHNQDEPQWIVAQRLLSALTTPEVFKSSAKALSFQQRLYNWSHLFHYQTQFTCHESKSLKHHESPPEWCKALLNQHGFELRGVQM